MKTTVTNQCAKCGATTEGGQFYRFYFGVVVDESDLTSAAEGKSVDPGPQFLSTGSEEVYYCDHCLIRAVAHEELIRSGFFLVLVIFAIVVVVFLELASSPGLWASVTGLIVLATLGSAAFLRYRPLRAATYGQDPACQRQIVTSTPKIQNMGDLWAIAHRRQDLNKGDINMFLTRSEHEDWSS